MRPLDPEQVYRIFFTNTDLIGLIGLIDFIYFRDLLKKARDGQAFSPVHIMPDVRVHTPLKSLSQFTTEYSQVDSSTWRDARTYVR